MSRSFGMSGLSEDSIRAPLRVWEYLLLIWHRLIVLSMLKNSPALLIKSGTAPFTFLREEAEGTETSQAIAFTLEHLSSAAPLGVSVSTWFKRQWRKWECFLETSRDWHKVPRQQSTLSWFYLNSLWLGAGKTKLGPSFSFTFGLIPFQIKLNYPEGLWVFLTDTKPRMPTQTPEDLE